MNVLFVGDNPFSNTGNGNMMAAILSQLDDSEIKPVCFASGLTPISSVNAFHKFPLNIIDGGSVQDDEILSFNRLWEFICTQEVEHVIFVGLDIWKYAKLFPYFQAARMQKKVSFHAIFPYDLQKVREDWLPWINFFDGKYVYSEYGYELLKPYVPDVEYFRPPLYNDNLFVPADKEKKQGLRKKHFPSLGENDVLVGFVGNNQFRKDPQGNIKGFFLAKKNVPNLKLYLHCDLVSGVFNLKQYAKDCGGKDGDIFSKTEGAKYPVETLIELYQCFDILLNCTSQEGLSYTPLEAMLCGIPVIVSDSTAHTELVGSSGAIVPCEEDYCVPVMTGKGRSFVESKKCDPRLIAEAIEALAASETARNLFGSLCREQGLLYLREVSHISEVLTAKQEATPVYAVRKEKILFAQHSSAGDVLMSTACLKPIKEKHPGLPLVYMTQKKYMNIVEGNPNIDQIVEWDDERLGQYAIVYNPHGERILPGGFNTLDTKLYEMYPYFCKVVADQMYIGEERLPDELYSLIHNEQKDVIAIQSSGGDRAFRTYKHMHIIVKMLKDKYTFVQVGDVLDDAIAGTLDYRGKLTFKQTASLFKFATAGLFIDSFPAHLAGHLSLPSVVLFGPAPARVTAPRDDRGVIVCLEANKLDVCRTMTACWGRGTEHGCTSPCINTINPMIVFNNLQRLLG